MTDTKPKATATVKLKEDVLREKDAQIAKLQEHIVQWQARHVRLQKKYTTLKGRLKKVDWKRIYQRVHLEKKKA